MAVTVTEPQAAALATMVSTRLDAALASLVAIGAGRNGRVYRVELSDGRRYVVKRYFRHRLDERDRLRTEFRALEFLWRSGVRCIPQPILVDPASDVAVYEAIEGQPLAPSDVGEADIDQAVEFLRTLRQLAPRAVPLDVPPASEACFSVQAILRNLDQRLARLTALTPDARVSGELQTFLDEEFMPVHDQLIRWCMSRLQAVGLDPDVELAPEHRTLSPSDFGFHNALRRRTGELVFLDFEYFGWDDPAKTICDVLLHPHMALGGWLKRRFVAQCMEVFKADRWLQPRTGVVYPLFGLKWCVILLNEFVPESLSRRLFAASARVDLERLHAEQLSKARRLLQQVVNSYEQFPDCD